MQNPSSSSSAIVVVVVHVCRRMRRRRSRKEEGGENEQQTDISFSSPNAHKYFKHGTYNLKTKPESHLRVSVNMLLNKGLGWLVMTRRKPMPL